MKYSWIWVGFLVAIFAENLLAAVTPQQLRCEYRINPLGVDVIRPRLSWILTSDDPAARGIVQQAYQVLAASSQDALAKYEGDLWDSGRVKSSQTLLFATRKCSMKTGDCLCETWVQTDSRTRISSKVKRRNIIRRVLRITASAMSRYRASPEK